MASRSSMVAASRVRLYDDTLRRFAAGPLDAICDMGGELIEAATLAGTSVAGALEATTTGLHRIRPLQLAFPVFDWNGIALKEAIHNRFHVGEETWPAFEGITGLSLFGRQDPRRRIRPRGTGRRGAGARPRRDRYGRRARSRPPARGHAFRLPDVAARHPRSPKPTSSSPRPASMASSAKRN